MFKKFRKLWLAVGALIVLCPLGLIAGGTAFGEWGLDEIGLEAGFIPAGLAQTANLWHHAPLADYGVAGLNNTFMQSAGGYILSAAAGVALVAGVILLLSKVVKE